MPGQRLAEDLISRPGFTMTVGWVKVPVQFPLFAVAASALWNCQRTHASRLAFIGEVLYQQVLCELTWQVYWLGRVKTMIACGARVRSN